MTLIIYVFMHFEDALYHEMTGLNFTGEWRCIKRKIYLNNMKNEALFWMNILWKRNHVPRKNWCNFCFKQRKWCKNQNLKGTETKSYLETWMKIWNLLDKFSIQTLKVYGVSARTLVQKTSPDHLWLEFYLAVMSPHQSPNQNVRLRSGNRENYISKYSDWGACCYFSQSLLLSYMMLDVNFFVSQ